MTGLAAVCYAIAVCAHLIELFRQHTICPIRKKKVYTKRHEVQAERRRRSGRGAEADRRTVGETDRRTVRTNGHH